MARWVLPTPCGPTSTQFSWFSMKIPDFDTRCGWAFLFPARCGIWVATNADSNVASYIHRSDWSRDGAEPLEPGYRMNFGAPLVRWRPGTKLCRTPSRTPSRPVHAAVHASWHTNSRFTSPEPRKRARAQGGTCPPSDVDCEAYTQQHTGGTPAGLWS